MTEPKEPKYIVSRRLENGGYGKAKMWIYTCDNGVDYCTADLARMKGLALDCLASRIAFMIKRDGPDGLSDPAIFRPTDKNHKKRPGVNMSDAVARELLINFLSSRKIKVFRQFIEIPGYEPVLVESGSPAEYV